MGIFDFFKKKKAQYDPLNLKVTDLDKGFLFDYDLKTWEVKEVYLYDWGDNFFTKEFKVSDSSDTRFLHIEEDDELEITLTQKIKVRSINNDLPEYIQENEYPPKTLIYNDMHFYKESENPGYFKTADAKDDQWQELISWDYYDDEDTHILNIEQWGEREFEASFGRIIATYEISNIVPAETQ